MTTFLHYLDLLYLGQRRSKKIIPNTAGAYSKTPVLRKDKVNRVLSYYGSFNPPHIGHLGVLLHAFESCPDLNIVAAVIELMPEKHLRLKNQQTGRQLVLSRPQRAALFENDSRVPDWIWVQKHNHPYIEEVRESPSAAAKEDGYDVKYVTLIGPDNWSEPFHTWAEHSEMLVSDCARSSPFLAANGVPEPLERFTAWQRLNLTRHEAVQDAEHPQHRNSTKRSHIDFAQTASGNLPAADSASEICSIKVKDLGSDKNPTLNATAYSSSDHNSSGTSTSASSTSRPIIETSRSQITDERAWDDPDIVRAPAQDA